MLTDIIKLLPDAVANQIAAGEVIQRPASAVKELLENALDAGATQIDLLVKDAGKTLIQVVDNGCGMSETDARMSFERHATSKIRKADDLFAIRTMGFRGEAMASIAAVAQVELRSRRSSDEFGTRISIEGSVVSDQQIQPMACGTSIAVKNLFFNVPARRNFLKSNPAEMRHIVEEFHRVSLMNPEIGFSLMSNDKELFHLYPGNLKQRIVALFGNVYNERLLPVNQQTDTASVDGFVGKAEFAKKTRGEQYFFVNKRFIKHPYLHHAIENAFHELLPKDSYPSYFLNINIDPSEIDINIHPTKTEVNFQDTKLVYAILHAAVKKTIGQHNLAPLIDFEVQPDMNIDFGEISRAARPVAPPSLGVNPDFNPFRQPTAVSGGFQQTKAPSSENWRILYGDRTDVFPEKEQPHQTETNQEDRLQQGRFLQLQQMYILCPVKSGLMLIDQHLAHWRILYEKYLKQLENRKTGSQQELFPIQVLLNATDADILHEIKPDLKILGFSIEELNSKTFVVNGTPTETNEKDIGKLIEHLIEQFKRNRNDLHLDKRLNLARSMAAQLAVKKGQRLKDTEMGSLVDQLFACHVSEMAPDGRKTFTILNTETLQSLFK